MADNLLLDPNSIPIPVSLASKLRPSLKTRSSDGALFLQQLHYWSLKECGREIDGTRWIWNTYQGWLKNFKWWTEWDFRVITKKLRELKLIFFCQPNDHERDRTGHYQLNYDHEWLKPLLTHHPRNNNGCTSAVTTTASEDCSSDITDTTSENSSDTTNNDSVEKKKYCEEEIKDATKAAPFMQSENAHKDATKAAPFMQKEQEIKDATKVAPFMQDEEQGDEETRDEATGDEETRDEETRDEATRDEATRDEATGDEVRSRYSKRSNNTQIKSFLHRLRLLRIPTTETVENWVKKTPPVQLTSNILALEELASEKGLKNPLAAFFAAVKNNWQPKNDKQSWWTAAGIALGSERRDRLIAYVTEFDRVLTVCFTNGQQIPFSEAKAMSWDAIATQGGSV